MNDLISRFTYYFLKDYYTSQILYKCINMLEVVALLFAMSCS